MDIEILPRKFKSWKEYDEYKIRYEKGLKELAEELNKIR